MSSLSYVEAEASETEAKHLLLRQIAKDVTVRLSEPLQVAESKLHTNLLSVSNVNGLAFAVTNSGFSVIRLSELRSFFKSAARNATPTLDKPLRSIDTNAISSIASQPTFISSANNHGSVLVGFQNGVIAAWSVSGLVDGSKLEPLFTLQPPSPELSLIDLVPNPSDRPELAVALYRQDGTSGVNSGTPIMVNLSSGSFGAQLDATGSRATAVCWSVKGKQIAVGLESGEIVQITPEGEPKDRIAKPPSLDSSYYVSDLRWLENHVFVATYNLPSSGSPDDDPEHSYEVYTILRDTKAAHITFAKMPMDPAPPYGDTSRPGTRYTAWLKGWEPSKHLVFVASGPSTDVGLISCSSAEAGAAAWSTVELEETSKPILPFSSVDQSSDTAPVAVDFDLTSTDEVDDPNAVARGDGNTTLPAVPILYVYTSDGVLLAYNVINTQGPFQSMVTPSGAPAAAPTPAPSSTPASATSTPAAGATAPAPATPSQSSSSTPAFGSTSAFGQPSAFGQTSAFGGAKSAFGSSAPAFGQSSAFGSPSGASATSPAFGSASKPTSGFGFGAFSAGAGNGKPASAFGSTGFGFGSASNTSKESAPSSPAPASTDKEASKTTTATPPTSTPGTSAFSAKPATSAFGSPSPAPTQTPSTGASAFGSTSAFGQAAAAKPAFGQSSAFGQTSAPAFGSSSSFGTTSAFGSASAFGAPSAFGSATSSPFASKTMGSTQSSSGSGFGAFGSSASTTDGKATSSGSGFGGFASKSGSAFGSAASPSSTSVFGSGGKLESKGPEAPKGLFGSSNQGSQKTDASPASAFTSSASGFGHGSFSAFAANKATEDKDANGKGDDAAGNGSTDSGSFSFGGLGGMLGSNDSAKSTQAAQHEKKTEGITTPDSGVDSTVQTSKSEAVSKPFSFNPSATSAGGTTTTTDASSKDAQAAKATSPPPTQPAFSSLKPGFNAGASFGSQPFSFGNNNKASSTSPAPTQTSTSNDAPAAQSKDTSATEEGQKKDSRSSDSDAVKQLTEPSKSSFSFSGAPAKAADPSASFSFNPAANKATSAGQDGTADAKPASPAPFSFASAAKPAASSAAPSFSGFGASAKTKPNNDQVKEAPASAENPKSSSPFSFANNASPAQASSAAKTSGFGGFTGFSTPAASSASQSKDVPAFSFADLDKSMPSPTSGAAASAAKSTPASAPAPAGSGSFLGFNSSAPRSSSPLASAPVNSSDETPNGSPEKPSAPAADTNKPFSFQQDSSKPLFGPSGFGAKPAAASSVASAPSGFSGFGHTTATKASETPKTAPTTAPATAPSFGGFGAAKETPPVETAPKAQTPASSGKNQDGRSGSPLVAGRTPQLSSSNRDAPAQVTESGIQGEFLKAYLVLTQELEVLRSNVDKCAGFLADLRAPTGLAQTVEDFADPSKWSFGDLPKMLTLAKSLKPLTQRIEDEAASHKRKVAELQSLQLKAEAKREEVARFIRARSDPEFAKMIRIRQLGPEHVENQNKLRKASQVVRDRIVELEEYLAVLKDKLQHAKTGRSALKAPSLDSIARACRNITARTTAVTLELDNLALEMDLMRPSDQYSSSREPSRALSRSVSVVSGIDEGTPLNDVSTLMRTLPAATTIRSADEITRAERIKRESIDVFIKARQKPALNTRAVPSSQRSQRKTTTPMQGSDLQIAFAKGPVHLGKRQPPAPPALPPASTPQTSAPAIGNASQGQATTPAAKGVPVPVLSMPPPPPASSSPATATASSAAPSRFGFPASPGPASSTPAAPTSAAPAVASVPAPKPAVSATPLNFGGYGSPAAAAPAKPSSAPFAGFGSSRAPAFGASSSAAPATSATKSSTSSTPLNFGGFGLPAAAPPKPTGSPFAGLGSTTAPASGAVANTTPAALAAKPAAPSTPLNFSSFGSPASAATKPASTPFSGFGSASTPGASQSESTKPASAPAPAPAPAPASSATPASSPFGSAKLSSINFGKLNTMPAGMFDLPAEEDTQFQPGGRAPSSSPSTIRSSHTKSKSRGVAVALPPASSSAGADAFASSKDTNAAAPAKAASDFFAQPLAPKPKEATTEGSSSSTPAFKGFSGFGTTTNKDAPKSDLSTPAVSAKQTFSFGDVNKKTDTPAVTSSSAEQKQSASGGFSFANFGKTETTAPAASITSEQTKPATSGFSFGDVGKKDAASSSTPPAPKPASGGFSFGDFGKKSATTPATSSPQPSQPATAGFSFAPAAAAKSSAEDKAEAPAAEAKDKDGKDKEDAKDQIDASSTEKDEDKKQSEEKKENEEKKAAGDKNESEEKKAAENKEATKDQDAKEKDAKDKVLPDPNTFTFCKPSEPRNQEPLTEPVSSEKSPVASIPAAATPASSSSPAPAAKLTPSFSFGTPAPAGSSEKKDTEPAKSESKNMAPKDTAGSEKPAGNFSYPPKPQPSSAKADNKPTSTSTSSPAPAFSFAPSKLDPSSQPASAFGAFKSSPGFGFGAFSKPSDSTTAGDGSTQKSAPAFSFAPKPTAFSFNPQSNKPGEAPKTAFGSVSAFGAIGGGNTSGPSTPVKSEDGAVKSAFSFSSGGGFGAFASSNKSSPFASASPAKKDEEKEEDAGDKSSASLLSRLGGALTQAASESGDDEDEDDYENEDEEDEEDYEDEDEDDYEDEEDYEDEDEEDYDDEEAEEEDGDEDDVDSAAGHDDTTADNTLDESAVHVSKADAQEQDDAQTSDDQEEDEDEDGESENDEEEGLSAVEEEPEEEEEAAEEQKKQTDKKD